MIMSFISLAIEFLPFAKNFDVMSDALFKLQVFDSDNVAWWFVCCSDLVWGIMPEHLVSSTLFGVFRFDSEPGFQDLNPLPYTPPPKLELLLENFDFGLEDPKATPHWTLYFARVFYCEGHLDASLLTTVVQELIVFQHCTIIINQWSECNGNQE